MEQHLRWARATAFDVRKRNPAVDGYERCGHQHPSVAAAKECQAAWFGDKPYGGVHVFGAADEESGWTPEQQRLANFYARHAHESALQVARTTPPRKRLRRMEVISTVGMGSCAIIGCGSFEAPADTRLCLECHRRLYQEAEVARATHAARAMGPVAGEQLSLF